MSPFEVGTSIELRAAHRMPDHPPPESELHEHDYRIDVVVERANLDDRGMVADLDAIDEALRRATARIAGRDLEEIRPPDAPAVTVEVLARWLHGDMASAVRAAGGEVLGVRVWESPTAFGGYRAPLS